MELIITSVQIIHVIVSVLLILVVLLQPGKSGDLGSIFGGGTSESVFGAAGAVPFLAKLTRGLAVLFMLTSLALGYLAVQGEKGSVVTDVAPPAVEQTAPDTTAAEGETAVPDSTRQENTETAEGKSAAQPENAATDGDAALESTETPADDVAGDETR